MSDRINIAERAGWLMAPQLQKLLLALSTDGEEARIVGGAVRNTLLDAPVKDVDIATTNLPDATIRIAEACGFKSIPTGIAHGTVTVVADGTPYEVTTLRSDVASHGRHATVEFGADWEEDAKRRDFTINALYATASGDIIDFVGGLEDIDKRILRFIGDASERIEEDHLRILRFFRFFAWYGYGRPDSQGLKACARLKDTITSLSAERIWSELKKLLTSPDPSRALLWMRQCGVLTVVLPESEKWGIDAIHALVRTEQDLNWEADALLRLEAIIPPDAERIIALGARLKMSNAERARLEAWARMNTPKPELAEIGVVKALYSGTRQALSDRLKLALVTARADAVSNDAAMYRAGQYSQQLEIVQSAEIPVFPVTGADLLQAGFEKGPQLGQHLRQLEEQWIASGFTLSRQQLLDTHKIK